MLTRTHKILIGMLVAQVALAIVMFTRGGDAAPPRARPLLASLDAANVTMLQIAGRDPAAPPVQLVKQGTGWVVKSSYDYPANDAKVADVLAKLTKLAAASPIATQPQRHKQLRVADADHERKLVITAGGKETTLYVGNPAGARRTAVRLGGATDVYAVAGLDAFALGGTPRDWVSPTYVDIAKADVAKVTLARGSSVLELERDGEAWKVHLDGKPLALASGESLATDVVDRLVDAATKIELTAPADPRRTDAPLATLTIVREGQANASTAPIVVDIAADGASAYWVHDRAVPRAVSVDKSRLSELVEVTRDKLVKKAEPAATTGAPRTGNG